MNPAATARLRRRQQCTAFLKGAMNPPSEKLAEAVRDERMEFDDALLDYLLETHADRLDLPLFWTLKIVIGYASMGEWAKIIAFAEAKQYSVTEIIDTLGLGPFVEPPDQKEGP